MPSCPRWLRQVIIAHLSAFVLLLLLLLLRRRWERNNLHKSSTAAASRSTIWALHGENVTSPRRVFFSSGARVCSILITIVALPDAADLSSLNTSNASSWRKNTPPLSPLATVTKGWRISLIYYLLRTITIWLDRPGAFFNSFVRSLVHSFVSAIWSITPSLDLRHSTLKTYLCHESFPSQTACWYPPKWLLRF